MAGAFQVNAFQNNAFQTSSLFHDLAALSGRKKRKRFGLDPIEIELSEKAKRRAAIELAVYGPEVEYSPPPAPFVAPAAPPVNVAELAGVIATAQAQQRQAMAAQAGEDDESDLESILREIL